MKSEAVTFAAQGVNSVMATSPGSVIITFPEATSPVVMEEAAEAARAFHQATGICILLLRGGASVHVVGEDAT